MEQYHKMTLAKSDILRELKSSHLPIIISGAGIVGEALLSLCKSEGITVDCFCDSSEKVAQSSFCGLDVILPVDLKSRYDDAILLISVAAIKDVVDLLETLGFVNWFAGGLLLNDIDVSQSNSDASIDYAKFAIENCILCHNGYLNPDKLFLRSIDFIITERCSLRCRDCSNLMQYYESPADCDLRMLLQTMEAFLAVIDEVMDFRIIGGDAFMNRQWPIIVERLRNEAKVKRIVLYTNGTIVPDDGSLEALVDNRALVIMTDYGALSGNLMKLKCKLERLGIAYHILTVDEWLDCAGIMPHGRTADENRHIYKTCCAKNMLTLSDGKLFRCPYAANAARLAAVPDCPTDYVDLFREQFDSTGINETRSKVRNYVLHKDYLESCDFCSGRPLSGKEVAPAVQTAKPLPYTKYRIQ